jgi:ABC-2 type transport system permease protein
VTFLATPRRTQVIAAKLVTCPVAGIGYALVCVAAEVAVALPWLAGKGIPVPLAGHGNLAVLGAVLVSAGLFGMTGAGLGALGSEIATIAGLLLYLYVAEPAVSHIAAFRSWTVYLPWAAVIALAGIAATVRPDIT